MNQKIETAVPNKTDKFTVDQTSFKLTIQLFSRPYQDEVYCLLNKHQKQP